MLVPYNSKMTGLPKHLIKHKQSDINKGLPYIISFSKNTDRRVPLDVMSENNYRKKE